MQADNVLDEIARRIAADFRPLRVLLFGSRARGAARPDSDYDLLVVLPEGADKWREASAIRDALAGLRVATDVIVTTPEEIARRGELVGTVLRPALHEGVVIYGPSTPFERCPVSTEEVRRETQQWLRKAREDLALAELG